MSDGPLNNDIFDKNILSDGERIDDLQIHNCYIIQNPEKFCFGMDAVLLSGFAKIKKGETVLDMGTGTGILPILLAAKTEGRSFTGLELQAESADMARRSVKLNNMEDRIDIVTGDIKQASDIFGAASYDVVVTNPPYMNENHGIVNPHAPKAIARHEIMCSLEDVVGQAARVLKVNGRLYMVHRPFRLVDIMELMVQYRLEPKRLRMVYPYIGKEPSMVLVEGVKGGRRRLSVEKPLIIYNDDREYTDEMKRDYAF
ncbi:MAG: tRNA1(Val) (adenine(37)-N6)-methyltransferase [Lachnospiraceae bacterium]|nr:tRNA1(Val) (adenine(37)-N6)-methyltransferase [Lachnospiraceae bacterium]